MYLSKKNYSTALGYGFQVQVYGIVISHRYEFYSRICLLVGFNFIMNLTRFYVNLFNNQDDIISYYIVIC